MAASVSVSRLWLIAVLVGGFLLSGCQSDSGQVTSNPVTVEQNELEPDLSEGVNIVPSPLPANVTARGVVLATVIIATGNVVSAVEAGLVSPEEVDLAREAIAQGRIQDWVDAAELDKALQ